MNLSEPNSTDYNLFALSKLRLLHGILQAQQDESPTFILKKHEPLKWTTDLLGLIHGHWEVKQKSKIDAISIDKKNKAGSSAVMARDAV